MKKRVLILEFRQETNSFNPIVMPMSAFNVGGASVGEEVFAACIRDKGAVAGAVEAFKEADIECIPSVFLAASPAGGRVADDVFAHLMEQVDAFAKSCEFDAIYASLHGATCTESYDDACGTLLAHLRELAGDKPITASFDLHANITEKLLTNIDIVCGYQTYPHRDFYQTGYRAGRMCAQMLEGKRFALASATAPLLLPPAGYTSDEGAFGDLISFGMELIRTGEILDFTVFPVQPWMDVAEIASRVIVIAEDENTAKKYADILAQRLVEIRDKMQPQLFSVDEIIDIAEKNESGNPVIVSEFADSPNGGCVGDSPIVPLELRKRGSKLKAAVYIRDPESVKQAFALGVGGKAIFSVGAGYTPGMPGPFVAEGVVSSLHDGHFTLEGPASRGVNVCIGLCAVVRFETIDILLYNIPSFSGDPQYFRHFGIEPSFYDLVVVKANTSFRLPYSKISPLIYNADTYGAGAADFRRFAWKKLPSDMYPFKKDVCATDAKIW